MTTSSRTARPRAAFRRRGRVRCAAAAAVLILTAAAAATGAAPAMADPQCVEAGTRITAIPWPQQMLDPQRAWPFGTGDGVTVAVVDSGVDAGVPQLSGRVTRGTSVVGHGRGDSDCLGQGTQAAGIIAARSTEGVGFAGIAPEATILPVKAVSDRAGTTTDVAEPDTLAAGIAWAVGHHARVVAVTAVAYRDSARLRAAVRDAARRDVLVVAATGDQARNGNPTPYPAADSGVLAVSGIDEDMTPDPDAGYGEYTDLAAPDGSVVAPQAGHGWVTISGTGPSAAFVAGTAALVRGALPNLSAAQVTARLTATASPATDASGGHVGYGVVNPYRAVTAHVPGASPSPVRATALAVPRRSGGDGQDTDLALLFGAVGVALAGLLAAGALLVPRAHRGRWRIRIAAPPPEPDETTPPGPISLLPEP